MDIAMKQSNAISLLRFPLLLLVLFVHSHAIDYPECIPFNRFADASIGEIAFTLFALIFDTLGMATVPTFFFISGFLFFAHGDVAEKGFYQNKLSKRFWTLLIPYLLWNLLAWLNTVGIPFLLLGVIYRGKIEYIKLNR